MAYAAPSWTQIVAHRGDSASAPENTVAAIESAIALQVDMVEVDIRLTGDGVAVLMHEETVDFTTSGTGLVTDFSWDEIRNLDAGSWRGPEFSGETVRSLDEILRLTSDRVALNLDIRTPDAAEPTAQAISSAGLESRTVISGCTAADVEAVRDAATGVSALLNVDDLLEGIDPDVALSVVHESVEIAVEVGGIAINVPHALVTTELVEHAHDAGIGLWTFTVDETDRFVALMELGADSITTNWPERMVPLVTDRIKSFEVNRR